MDLYQIALQLVETSDSVVVLFWFRTIFSAPLKVPNSTNSHILVDDTLKEFYLRNIPQFRWNVRWAAPKHTGLLVALPPFS